MERKTNVIHSLVSGVQNEYLATGDGQHVRQGIAIQIAENESGSVASQAEARRFSEPFVRTGEDPKFGPAHAVDSDYQLCVLARLQLMRGNRRDGTFQIEGLQHLHPARPTLSYNVNRVCPARGRHYSRTVFADEVARGQQIRSAGEVDRLEAGEVRRREVSAGNRKKSSLTPGSEGIQVAAADREHPTRGCGEPHCQISHAIAIEILDGQ
jgi:hypothetical protein